MSLKQSALPWCGVAVVVLVSFVILIVSLWAIIPSLYYTRSIRPGQVYNVCGRAYRMPNVKARCDGPGGPWRKPATTDVSIPILSEGVLNRQRELLQRITAMLTDEEIRHWVAGGTLIGFHGPFQTFIPWDDDIDIHTTWEHREWFFSDQCTRLAQDRGLEIIQLRGQDQHKAFREGAAVRFRLQGDVTPVCDVFFEKEKEAGIWGKVDGWNMASANNGIVWNRRESWSRQDLFPLQKKRVDGMDLWMPANPEAIVKVQYGDRWRETMVYRPPLFSHHFPFHVGAFVWRVRKMS